MPRLPSFLSPLLAVGAAGCGDCAPVDLTADERAWVSAYQPGQQLTFRSRRGSTSTFTVQPLKEWHDNQNCNPLESGKYQPIRSTLVLTPATSYGGNQDASFSLLAYKTSPDHPVQLTFNLAGLLCQATDPPGAPNPCLVRLVPESLTVAGRPYPQAQRIRADENGTINMGTTQLRAAWWDRQAALLRYELAGGEVFELVKK